MRQPILIMIACADMPCRVCAGDQDMSFRCVVQPAAEQSGDASEAMLYYVASAFGCAESGQQNGGMPRQGMGVRHARIEKTMSAVRIRMLIAVYLYLLTVFETMLLFSPRCQ